MRKNSFFALISRMRYIDRWALMRNTETENVQEHSHRVAILAHAIAVVQNAYYGGNLNADRIAVAALYHDATEIITGDMPTPVKYLNASMRDTYKTVEGLAADQLLETLPEELRSTYRPFLHEQELDEEEHRIVKAADKLDAYIKCAQEVKAGNNEFRLAAKQGWKALQEMKDQVCGLSYVMEQFIPAFCLTLDELQTEPEEG